MHSSRTASRVILYVAQERGRTEGPTLAQTSQCTLDKRLRVGNGCRIHLVGVQAGRSSDQMSGTLIDHIAGRVHIRVED